MSRGTRLWSEAGSHGVVKYLRSRSLKRPTAPPVSTSMNVIMQAIEAPNPLPEWSDSNLIGAGALLVLIQTPGERLLRSKISTSDWYEDGESAMFSCE